MQRIVLSASLDTGLSVSTVGLASFMVSATINSTKARLERLLLIYESLVISTYDSAAPAAAGAA